MSGAVPVRALLGHLERAFSKPRTLIEPASSGQRRQQLAFPVLECP
jgi:hypothetical protein